MQIPPLSQAIGSAERALRALLEPHLREAGISFPAWTLLAFTSGTPMQADHVAQQQLAGHIVDSLDDALREIEHLLAVGLITRDLDDNLRHTHRGAALFSALGGRIKLITQTLYADFPDTDLETTHRTLLEITQRANHLLPSLRP